MGANKNEKIHKKKHNIKADIIILGCSLPGIVTAHKLKKKFGDTIDIVVLDLAQKKAPVSSTKTNVVFTTEHVSEPDDSDVPGIGVYIGKYYLAKFALDFSIPIPTAITDPRHSNEFVKIFQHNNGSYVSCDSNYHDFKYLNFLERFELQQYQSLIDDCMKNLFQTSVPTTKADRLELLYYDRTTMERHLSKYLIFNTSKEIMRHTIRLVCGAPATSVSVLFYLHQCHRTRSCRNFLDGENTAIREKLLGYCRKRISTKLQQSVADITLKAKPIKQIRLYSDAEVILETKLGETDYVCNMLAMALSPEELRHITVETELLEDENDVLIPQRMIMGRIKRFMIEYERNIWQERGYSGHIVSIRGPIIWAIERPQMSATGATRKYATMIGYLDVVVSDDEHRDEVIEQLVTLFGDEARGPVSYTEKDVNDLYVPEVGDYLTLYEMTVERQPKCLEWAALDVFADGDFTAAIEAGHRAYVHLLTTMRPQAKSFDDVIINQWPTTFGVWPLTRFFQTTGILGGIRLAVISTVLLVGAHFAQQYVRKRYVL